MMCGGACYRQPSWEHRIKEIEPGLWPTPTADAANERRTPYAQGGKSLSYAAKLWPTPRARDHKGKGFPDQLPNAVAKAERQRTWPTPTARDHTGHQRSNTKQGGNALREEVGGSLNPPWVEWLMGWPIGWTALKPLAMAKFQQWLQQHGGCSVNPNNPNPQGGTMNLHPDKTKVTIIQSRAEMNLDLINEYAQEMKDGTIFDAIDAIRENGHFYIYNGAHRVEAARQINFTLDISWTPGTRADAEWAALAANTKHGLRRSTATKQRVAKNALLHEKGAGLSDREIARWCQVDHKTVGKLRKGLEASGEIPQIAERTVTRNGKTFTQAAKAEPEYAAVWQLEEGVKSWLGKALHSANATKISILTEIKKKTASGKRNLERLLTSDIILPSPRRKQDVVQACNNVLDQMEQAAK
ncbi:hypothetical protein LCGC14_1162040, partial [marine sediment metagenome]